MFKKPVNVFQTLTSNQNNLACQKPSLPKAIKNPTPLSTEEESELSNKEKEKASLPNPRVKTNSPTTKPAKALNYKTV